mmetsp:Transcript_21180/g.73075  ORF Transcript_21180/g.73075 Transcript_21180/m.73075 type:complete len:269 (-) Transcript_21180:2-808(-)
MPWILCGPLCPPESTADSSGSTAMIWRFGCSGLRYCPHPVSVPPVPTPAMRMSICPAVCSQISGPVVSRCTFGLSGLLNCCSKKPLGPSSLTICSAFETAPPMPLEAEVRMSSAPNAFSSPRRSIDMDSGMVKIREYPLDAATMASAMPVLPDVGSTKVVTPGVMSPRFSASAIIDRPMRSLTELHGFIISSLTTTSQPQPATTRLRRHRGVPPINSVTSSAICSTGAARATECRARRGGATIAAAPATHAASAKTGVERIAHWHFQA